MNETPLSCWVIVEENGEICCAHCNCMAGLGATCTYIIAVLFYIEAVVSIQGTRTCTQSQCAWAIPSYVKSIDYQPITNIDFTSAYGKKRKLDEMIEQSVSLLTDSKIDKDDSSISIDSTVSADSPVSTSEDVVYRYVPQPTDEEMSQLYEALNVAGTKPAILSLIDPYSDKYVPISSLSTYPKLLKSLQQPVYADMQFHELLAVCETVSLEMTAECQS